ncbi:MAG: hypothetical protein QM725_13980 [Lacibacter sp.]
MNRILFSVVLLSMLIFSCQKQEENKFDCGATPACNVQCIAFWSYFNFSIVDKNTGEDLLFGNNPTLTPSDIKLFVKSNSPYRQIVVLADSSTKILRTYGANDTMALQVKNEPLQYIVVKNFCGDCCSRTVVEMVHEGQLLVADKSKVIRIKR